MSQFQSSEALRAQFPQTTRKVWDRDLIYLDSAATTLKPQSVVDVLTEYYARDVANIHRAAHFLGDQGTTRYEAVREKTRAVLNARFPEEIVFTKGTTEGVNLVAATLVPLRLKKGDQILLSEMEHHSNIVPWQLAASKVGAEVLPIPVTEQGELDLDAFHRLLTPQVKILSLTHVSNALGTVNPLEKVLSEARSAGVITVVDAAQSVALGLVDVQKLGCDFLVFSGHKVFGPNGIGVLYGRKEIFQELPPYQGGGSMISEVDFKGTTYLGLPHRFEAGTPPIGEVLGLGSALDFLTQLDQRALRASEKKMVDKLVDGLNSIPGTRLIGDSPSRVNIVSFVMKNGHPSDVGQLLDRQGIAVRAGHHCCQPLMRRMKVPGTVRASFSVYNREADVDALLTALDKVKGLLQ